MKRLEDRKIRVELTERAKDLLIAEGYDPMYGARPLKRTIQRRVLDPLAMRCSRGNSRRGRHPHRRARGRVHRGREGPAERLHEALSG